MAISREDTELWAASRVVAMHYAAEGCAQCGPDGCRLRDWATARLRAWQVERGHAPPTPEPAWSPGTASVVPLVGYAGV